MINIGDYNSSIQYNIGPTSLPPTVESFGNDISTPMGEQMSLPFTIENSRSDNKVSQTMPATAQPMSGMISELYSKIY